MEQKKRQIREAQMEADLAMAEKQRQLQPGAIARIRVAKRKTLLVVN